MKDDAAREELRALARAAARAVRARLGKRHGGPKGAGTKKTAGAAPARPIERRPTGASAPAVARPVAARPATEGAARLAEVEAVAKTCVRCRLCEGRKSVVFGVGSPAARLMVIGEGPGEQEDLQGLPFVGRAGQLLTKMLAAIGLERDAVYVTNVVKCRPPANRNPLDDEIAACEPYLLDQIRLVRPEVLLLLGNHAVRTLLGVEVGISKVRGRLFRYEGILCVPSYHPAYLLRSPAKKAESWEDLKVVRGALDGTLDVSGATPARPRTRPPDGAPGPVSTPSLFG